MLLLQNIPCVSLTHCHRTQDNKVQQLAANGIRITQKHLRPQLIVPGDELQPAAYEWDRHVEFVGGDEFQNGAEAVWGEATEGAIIIVIVGSSAGARAVVGDLEVIVGIIILIIDHGNMRGRGVAIAMEGFR